MSTQLLTASQVADRMALSLSAVRRMLRTGELTAAKQGNTWIVPETSITQWVETHIYTP